MAHNSGRSQIGPWALSFRHDFPLLNFVKMAASWQAGTTAFPAILSANGYPQSTPALRLLTGFPFPYQHYTGPYILTWVGDGKIDLDAGGYTVLEGSEFVPGSTEFNLNAEGVNGRVKFQPNGANTQAAFYFRDSNGVDPLRNVKFYRADHESRVLAGEVWNPDYIAKYREANFGILRPMDWMKTNNSHWRKWSHRNVVDDWSYAASRWLPSLWGGAVSGTDTYTASAATDTPGIWTDGEFWQGQFTNANTSTTPTINIGARGAKTIVANHGGALAVGGIAANALATLMYDADLDRVLYHSGGLNGGGVPQELMIELCNELRTHAQIQVPLYFEDDLVTQLATLWKGSLDLGLRAYYGFSNEIWNFIFSQTTISEDKGELVLAIPAGDNRRIHGWYANRYLQMVGLIEAAYGAQSNFRRVIEVQAAGNGPQYDTYRFKGTDLSVSAPNRPIDHCDAIQQATYFQGAITREFDASYDNTNNAMQPLLDAADDWDSGDPARKQDALDWLDDDIRRGVKNGVPGGATLEAFEKVGGIYERWHTYAVQYGIKFMEYEGALALAAPTTARLTVLGIDTAYSAKIAALIDGYRKDQRAKQLTLDRYNNFVALSNAEFPSQYLMAGSSTWAVINDDLYDAPYKTFDAIVEFNRVFNKITARSNGRNHSRGRRR